MLLLFGHILWYAITYTIDETEHDCSGVSNGKLMLFEKKSWYRYSGTLSWLSSIQTIDCHVTTRHRRENLDDQNEDQIDVCGPHGISSYWTTNKYPYSFMLKSTYVKSTYFEHPLRSQRWHHCYPLLLIRP